jgi:hypothetical protein
MSRTVSLIVGVAAALFLTLAVVSVVAPPATATHVDGAPHTFVNNPSTEPVNVTITPQAFERTISASWAAGASISSSSFAVPSGMRLVVEYVTISAGVPAGQRVRAQVTASAVPHYVEVAPQGNFGLDRFVSAQAMRAYAGPGTTVTVYAYRNSSSGTGSWVGSLTGYLTPV